MMYEKIFLEIINLIDIWQRQILAWFDWIKGVICSTQKKRAMRKFAISIFINEHRYWYRHPVLDNTEPYLEHIRYNKEIVEIKIKEKKRFIGNRHLPPPSKISKKKENFPPTRNLLMPSS